jgi:hypothetical protein
MFRRGCKKWTGLVAVKDFQSIDFQIMSSGPVTKAQTPACQGVGD